MSSSKWRPFCLGLGVLKSYLGVFQCQRQKLKDNVVPMYTVQFVYVIYRANEVHSEPADTLGPDSTSSYQYRKSHCGDKTVVRSSYLHNGISYTGKISSLLNRGPGSLRRQATNMPDYNTCCFSMVLYLLRVSPYTVDEWFKRSENITYNYQEMCTQFALCSVLLQLDSGCFYPYPSGLPHSTSFIAPVSVK